MEHDSMPNSADPVLTGDAVRKGLFALGRFLADGRAGTSGTDASEADFGDFSDGLADTLAFLSVKETAGLVSVLTDEKLTAFAVANVSGFFSEKVRSALLLSACRSLSNRRKSDGSRENGLRETARVVSSLLASSRCLSDAADVFVVENVEAGLSFLLSRKDEWHTDIYDLVYILHAVAAAGLFFPDECRRIMSENKPEWAHPGTTALIMDALRSQSLLADASSPLAHEISDFLSRKGRLLAADQNRRKYTATSCLVFRALDDCGFSKDVRDDLAVLISKQGADGLWENSFNTTCLALCCLSRSLA